MDCNKCYIGQTKQYLYKRINQHKLSIKNFCTSPNSPKTALTEHSQSNLHNFNFASTSILHKENNLKKRLFLEMTEIQKNKNSVNYQSDLNGLSSIYCNLIQ